MSAMSSYASTPKKRRMTRTWSSVVDKIPSDMKRDMDILALLQDRFDDFEAFYSVPLSMQTLGLRDTLGDDSPLVQTILDLLATPQVRVVMPMICIYTISVLLSLQLIVYVLL